MSLILDALRRADSERGRGAVPGLHAQPVPPLPLASPRVEARRGYRLALAVAAVLAAAFGAYVVSREAGRSGEPSAAPATVPAAGVAMRPPAPDAPVPAAASPPPAATAASAPSARAAPARPAEPQFVAEPAPWPAKAERPASAGTPPAAAQREVAAAPAAPAPPPEPPVYTRDQLPENIRAELPQLTVGGSIYSASPADRSVIINGRIFRENDRLTNDLSLEQIRLKSVVLSYKGYRFELGF